MSRLSPPPSGLAETRIALHRIAEEEVSPPRREATGKIGLRATPGGFGTPVFGEGRQVRVEGTELVSEAGGPAERRALEVDAAGAAFLAQWFDFSFSVLEDLRRAAGTDAEPSIVQLWPEHFDAAIEAGSEAGGKRAAFGCSPGDEQHPEPYCYVAPWTAEVEGPGWNATGFRGAELSYAELREAQDPHARALEFFIGRLRELRA